jgi:uncharacterized protein with von Willebrand factor type A (vWA) domain
VADTADKTNRGVEFLRSLVRFAHTLRGAGLPVTVAQIRDLARALPWVDVGDREQVFHAARALLVTRKEDLALFELLFRRFWRAPADGAYLPQRVPPAPRHDPATQGRFTIVNYMAFKARAAAVELDVADRAGTWTDVEQLRSKRFAEMTPEELDAVARLTRAMRWRVAQRRSRRWRSHAAGRVVEFRRVLRQASRLGAVPAKLPWKRRTLKRRPVILIADISGSMEKYSRLVLQFFHSAQRALRKVETFVFATRLSRITAQLELRNIDRAIDEAAAEVSDWAGGTRIGECLRAFNRDWGRRVLRRGAVVAIISDGCDRGNADLLRREMRWLQHRCHRLLWLNPHLGHPQYRPLAAGMQAALEYVDDFLPVDDLSSLEAFSAALAGVDARASRTGRGQSFARSTT